MCIFNINFRIAMFLKTGVHVYTVAVLFAVKPYLQFFEGKGLFS